MGDDAANGSPILSLIFNEISELLVNKEYEFEQRSECPENKYDRNIVLEWFGVSHTGQIQRTEVFPYFSYMDGLMLTHPI